MADAPESQFKRVLVCPCWNIRLDVGPTVAVDDPPVFRVLSEACAAVLPASSIRTERGNEQPQKLLQWPQRPKPQKLRLRNTARSQSTHPRPRDTCRHLKTTSRAISTLRQRRCILESLWWRHRTKPSRSSSSSSSTRHQLMSRRPGTTNSIRRSPSNPCNNRRRSTILQARMPQFQSTARILRMLPSHRSSD